MKGIIFYREAFRRKQVRLSLLWALFLIIGGYFVNCLPLFTGENLNDYTWMQVGKEMLGIDDTDDDIDDALFVNVSYDKELTEYKDHTTSEIIGNTDITDRKKLSEFLQIVKDCNNYKYFILDVRFEKGIKSPNDSALFSLIYQMPRLVVATHQDIESAAPVLESKSALADYSSTIVATNFARYKYMRDGEKSVPLYAYEELTGKSMKQFCMFTTCDYRPCYSSIFLPFSTRKMEMYGGENGEKMYYQLGSDLLSQPKSEIQELIDGKIVVVGDMAEDMHDTYIGIRQGSLILYRALSCLIQGKHFVSFWLMAFMFIIYFAITYTMFTRKSLYARIKFIRECHSKLLHFILSFIGFTFVLSIIEFLLFIVFQEVYSVLLASTFYSILSTYLTYKAYDKA